MLTVSVQEEKNQILGRDGRTLETVDKQSELRWRLTDPVGQLYYMRASGKKENRTGRKESESVKLWRESWARYQML